MPSVSDVTELQQAIRDLTVLAAQDVDKLWRLIVDRGLDPVQIRDMLIAASPDLVLPYVTAATQLSAQWYDEQLPDSTFRAATAALPQAAELAASATWAAGPAFAAASGTATSVSPADLLTGSLQRRIYNGSRETVAMNADREEGATWARYASASACAFCRMLATRGEVYSSKAAATRVVGRGKDASTNFDPRTGKRKSGGQAKGVRTRGAQKAGDKYHDHCHCMAVPVRPGDSYAPPSYVDEWQQQYLDAVRATSSKEKYGAIDTKAVLAHMDKASRESRD
ncbi:hypothetical protein ACFWQG_13085 [Rhodococcus sp. NPDC058532]|uniref:VG15 protein n=1 Tax=Rhodococcus sp. NPDC058532 TaxID=3346540 RepID=UPI00365AB940